MKSQEEAPEIVGTEPTIPNPIAELEGKLGATFEVLSKDRERFSGDIEALHHFKERLRLWKAAAKDGKIDGPLQIPISAVLAEGEHVLYRPSEGPRAFREERIREELKRGGEEVNDHMSDTGLLHVLMELGVSSDDVDQMQRLVNSPAGERVLHESNWYNTHKFGLAKALAPNLEVAINLPTDVQGIEVVAMRGGIIKSYYGLLMGGEAVRRTKETA